MDLQQLPKDDELLWTAFKMYKSTDLAPVLKTEKNRTVFAEKFDSVQALPLSTLCLKIIANNYKGRPIKLDLSPTQFRIFYDFLPDLPIEKCIQITDELYWKRMFVLKCTNKMELKQKTMQKDVHWKELVITRKFTEVIEQTPFEIWIVDDMDKLAKLVAPYIPTLHISKLQAKRDDTFVKALLPSESTLTDEADEEKTDEEEEEEVEKNKDGTPKPTFAIEDCHHGDLSFVKNLTNMTSLTVEFLPPQLGIKYNSRYFDFSYVDVQNLANGVSDLKSLREFNIRRSRMDSSKMSTILEALKLTSVEHVEFYFCQLDDECGESLYEYLMASPCLNYLNLSGNYFRDMAVDYLSDGIKNGPPSLFYLGLSNNPIFEESLCRLLDTILTSAKELKHLTLSGIHVSERGANCIAKMIKNHPTMEELEILAVPMNPLSLVDAMDTNKKLQHLLCQGCGLSLEDEFKIELLLKRNRHIKANPYIGDPTKTEEEIVAFVSRIKNPILLAAMAIKDKRDECLQKRDEREKAYEELMEEPEQVVEGAEEFEYNAVQFTEEELNARVRLFDQNNNNFFRKKRTIE